MTTFVRGQIVRLRNGWTPMQVIDVNHATGKIRAKYCHKFPVLYSDFEHPYAACSCQHRHASQFVHWDGDPDAAIHAHPTRTRTPMNKFSLKTVTGAGTPTIGTKIAVASNGDYVLEMSNGTIFSTPPENLLPYYQKAVKVKANRSNYTCNYIVPDNAIIKVGDLLLSDSGNLYHVTETDVQGPGTVIKNEFKGKLLVTRSIA